MFYQRALAIELPGHDLEFEREVWIDVYYKGRKLGRKRVDFVVEEVMVEIKAKFSMPTLSAFSAIQWFQWFSSFVQ